MRYRYWPAGVPREATRSAFIQAFQTLGYAVCVNSDYEAGFVKIAIFEADDGRITHAARQIDENRWTSKLGEDYDIFHELFGLNGEIYGKPKTFMKIPIKTSNS